MPRFQFHLRTLLLLTLIAGCGLGWWFRPYTIETRWPDGRLKSQSLVRRNLAGGIITNGTQSWWWPNGQLARRGESHGVQFPLARRRLSFTIPLAKESLYNESGEPMELRGIEFGLMWISFHQDLEPSELWPLSDADRFPETPHE